MSLSTTVSKPYPGRVIKTDEEDAQVVLAIQQRLNALGCGPIEEDGIFQNQTEAAVKLFQARSTDTHGNPLVIDGQVGAITWGALFGNATTVTATQPTGLAAAVIAFAKTQLNVREQPLGSNRGPQVDQYLRAVGLNPAADSYPWCVAFTYFCYQQAASQLGVVNPHIKTAGVLDHWNKAANKPGVKRLFQADAVAQPARILPGNLFIIDAGGGMGHSGIVVSVQNGYLETIEGNTNEGGSRNGIGVFQRNSRKIASINKGFIDYSGS